MKLLTPIFTIFALVSVTRAQQFPAMLAADPALRLEQAIHSEEILGNRAAALLEYLSIVQDPSAAEALRQQATERAQGQTARVGSAKVEILPQGVIQEQADRLNQKTINQVTTEAPPLEPLVGVGLALSHTPEKLICQSVMLDSPAELAGIQEGWEILLVDGKSPWELGGTLELIVKAIRGPEGSPVVLSVKNLAGETQSVALLRANLTKLEGPTVQPLVKHGSWFAAQEHRILGIKLPNLGTGTASQLREVLADPQNQPCRGILLDLTANGGGSLQEAQQVVECFLAQGTLGSQVVQGERKDFQLVGTTSISKVPLVLISSGTTAAAAELVLGALQHAGRATIVGQPSLGHGGIRQIMPDGSNQEVGRLFLANGKALHRDAGMKDEDSWGVTPDVLVPLSDTAPNPRVMSETVRAGLSHLKKHLEKP